jgi:hypothetical protein
MTPSGIESTTFWLVAHCPNQLRHRVPPEYVTLVAFSTAKRASLLRCTTLPVLYFNAILLYDASRIYAVDKALLDYRHLSYSINESDTLPTVHRL